MMMTETGEKEPPIAGRAAIGALKECIVKEPIFEAASSRTEELFATAIGANRNLLLRCGFVHTKILWREGLCYSVYRRELERSSNSALRSPHSPRDAPDPVPEMLGAGGAGRGRQDRSKQANRY
jgi:hypothetical protein